MWKNNNPNQYFIDYTSEFTTPLKEGILFEAYRYGGGLGFRFKEQWNKNNCNVLTSEGKNRMTADGTKAKWCIIYGESNNKNQLMEFFYESPTKPCSSRTNERVWPITAK